MVHHSPNDLTDMNSFSIQDGTTSVALDTDLLSSELGLTLSSVDNTVESISEEFPVGFDISDQSDFEFNKDNGFTPIAGEIEHTGTVTFSSLLGNITLGDFAVGFDPNRQTEDASGFYVKNTVDGILGDEILFDVSNPESLEIGEMELRLGKADLLVPQDANTLLAMGLPSGYDLGDIAINASFVPESVQNMTM